jgi:hypothetical protein
MSPLPPRHAAATSSLVTEGKEGAVRSRLVSVCLCTMIALVTLSGAPGFRPAAVFAASGTVSLETPLHDSPDPAAPMIALLSEGTIVSIDGPPVEGFYPVTVENASGWIRGETVQVEKDTLESVAAEEIEADPLVDSPDETTPMQAPVQLEPATNPDMSTTVEPATDPDVDPSAATEASTPMADLALVDETEPTTAPVPAGELAPANEPVPMDGDGTAPELASTGEVTHVPVTADGAVPPPDSAAPSSEDLAEPTIDANVTPMSVEEGAAVGPASVMADAPILLGPGPDYGFIATAPAGSTVVKTGHVIDGYATVQYAEVTGWLALTHLGAPGIDVEVPPPAETAPPVEAPSADAAPIEIPPADAAPAETLPPELAPTETPPLETPAVETALAEVTSAASVPVDMAPIVAPPVYAPAGEVAPVEAP